jgi:hypothetical protein
MTNQNELALKRRKNILERLGFTAHASRSSWSHDLEESIVFDAWEHQWQRDNKGAPTRYPLRTNGAHYNLAESRRNPRPGHTRWQKHVDLVVAGQRKPRAIVPVAVDPNASPNKGSKGWRPLVIEGHFELEDDGEVWLRVDEINPL